MDQTLINKMASWMPWAKSSGKRSSSEEDEGGEDEQPNNLLLSLLYPDVSNVVLDFLDSKSLLALRLVCRKTKYWVDQPRYLSKIRITLHPNAGSKNKMRKVLRSKVDFCNFRIGFENKRHNEELIIMDFGSRFGPTLKVLDINTMTSHFLTVSLLAQSPSLESLSLLGLNLLQLGQPETRDLTRISHVLGNLRVFSVGNVVFIHEAEMEYFRTFLSHCTKLVSLRLPYINFQSKRPKECREEILDKYVLDPVLVMMEMRGAQQTGNNIKYLVLEYLNSLTPPLFLRVAEVCYRFNTILHNVHESYLKGQRGGQTRVQEIIGTLDGLNSSILMARLVNLKCISIWTSSALTLSEQNLGGALMPRLANINLYVDATEEDPRCNRLVSSVLGVGRPSVTSLKVSYNSRKGAVSAELMRGAEIATNFQFLRKLDIYQWDAYDEEFIALWQGLGSHRIQDLSLLLCTNLSDKGLLGWEPKKPALLALTGLKELHISSLYGSITDVSVHRALRHMPLTKLRLYSQSITYDGIACLLEGVFFTTVDYVHCSKPLDCTQKEFYYLMKDIVSAKNYPEFPSSKRRHTRRLSQPLVFSEPSDEE